MTENYKHLYEQTKKMLTMYQDELIPGFRKQVEELEAKLSERERVVIQLRKQWQDAETHICTMCGHFDHKTDGNIVYGNKTCGEICGYPFCKEKFTMWIPVTERLPNPGERVIVRYETECSNLDRFRLADMFFDVIDNKPIWDYLHLKITHWMPMLEPPADDLK